MTDDLKKLLLDLKGRRANLLFHMHSLQNVMSALNPNSTAHWNAVQALTNASRMLRDLDKEIDYITGQLRPVGDISWTVGANYYISIPLSRKYIGYKVVPRDVVEQSGGYDMIPHLWITEALIGRN